MIRGLWRLGSGAVVELCGDGGGGLGVFFLGGWGVEGAKVGFGRR